jgi:hypothetical protein
MRGTRSNLRGVSVEGVVIGQLCIVVNGSDDNRVLGEMNWWHSTATPTKRVSQQLVSPAIEGTLHQELANGWISSGQERNAFRVACLGQERDDVLMQGENVFDHREVFPASLLDDPSPRVSMKSHGRPGIGVGKVAIQEHLDDRVREIELVSFHNREFVVEPSLRSCGGSV